MHTKYEPFTLWAENKFVKYGNTVIQSSIKQKVFPYQFIDASTPSATAMPYSDICTTNTARPTDYIT